MPRTRTCPSRAALCTTAAVVLLALPATADVTVRGAASGGYGVTTSSSTTTTYIKGHKMRVDTNVGTTTYTTIFDVDAQRMITFDTTKREAEVWNMKDFAASLAQNVNVSDMTASVKPNGKTKTIAGKTARGYDLEIVVPASKAQPQQQQQQQMPMTVKMSGPTWIVTDAPGADEYARFYRVAAEKGFLLGDPRSAKEQPGHAKATSEMYRKLADIGGIAYETTMTIALVGEGPLAGVMDKMGRMTSTSTVTAIETGKLQNELFAPPAGYQIKERTPGTGVGR